MKMSRCYKAILHTSTWKVGVLGSSQPASNPLATARIRSMRDALPPPLVRGWPLRTTLGIREALREAMIRVLVVDDNGPYRQAITRLVESQPDMEVVATAGTLSEARAMLGGVDVALMDRVLPDGDSLELIGELREASPGAKVLVMSATVEDMHPNEALEAGADGVVDKVETPERLFTTIRSLRGK
jgi:CheY-like chemotaxis protein